MNIEITAALVLFGGLTAAIAWRRWLRRRVPDLPGELGSARLVYAEQLFCSQGPVSIKARVDRVYQTATGELLLVELKTRTVDRVYRSDVIELSAQRVALAGQTGQAVANHAYVLTERPDGRRAGWHRVKLVDPGHVIALVERREQLLAGSTVPLSTRALGMCRQCAQVQLCRQGNQ